MTIMTMNRAAVWLLLIGIVLSVIFAAQYAKAQKDNGTLGAMKGDWVYYGGTIALLVGAVLGYKKLTA